jgi:hypothetical protein
MRYNLCFKNIVPKKITSPHHTNRPSAKSSFKFYDIILPHLTIQTYNLCFNLVSHLPHHTLPISGLGGHCTYTRPSGKNIHRALIVIVLIETAPVTRARTQPLTESRNSSHLGVAATAERLFNEDIFYF